MTDFPWDASYSVGHPAIDRQHQTLLELVNDLRKVADTQDPLEEYRLACAALIAMRDYAYTHFEEEEKLMAAAAYPELAAHRALHAEFFKTVREIEEQLHAGERVASLDEFCNLLDDWWKQHILQVDRRYADYLKATG